MNRILCLTFAMSVLAGPALADMSEGIAAATMGDYPRAISEFEPLANSGDAVAQYQLGKLYLEGHGPADGVARGVELMTKSAQGNHPEAQAQLGLMYAMGLGVPVDNAKAYEWLTKAVDALPDGTRRTVAAANRDAVQKRMGMGTGTVTTVAATPKTTTETPPPAKPAKVETQAAATPAAKPAATKTEATATTTKATTTAKAEAKPAETPAATATTKPAAKVESAKVETAPAATSSAAKPAATTTTTAPAAKVTEASNTKPAKTPNTSTQVASAKAPDAAPASGSKQPTGVRIQLVSMPSEDAAWAAWKQLSGKYSTQLTGLTAMIETADLGTKGTFYRVQTGPFDTVAAAQERCTAMKQAGLDCLVVGKP